MSGKQEFPVLSFRALITRGSRCTSYLSPLRALLPQPSAPACHFWEPSPASSRWRCPQITLTGDHPQQHRHSLGGFLGSSGVCRAPLPAFDKFNPASSELQHGRSLFRCDLNHTNPLSFPLGARPAAGTYIQEFLKSSRGRRLKARELVQQAKSSFVYEQVLGFILPSRIGEGSDHGEQTLCKSIV